MATSDQFQKRSSHHAHRLIRLMTKVCAIQRIGHQAFALVSIVAHQEDAIRYERPVSYYNSVLMAVCGFNSVSSLDRARRNAVDAGWLKYVPGDRRGPGLYWTDIPSQHAGIADSPTEDGDERSYPGSCAPVRTIDPGSCAPVRTIPENDPGSCATSCAPVRMKPEGYRKDTAHLSTLSLFLQPDSPEEAPAAQACPERNESASGPDSGGDKPEGTKPRQPELAADDPSDITVLTFPVSGKPAGEKTWNLRASKLQEFAESFPGVDCLAECRKARQWCIDNASKRKTAGGMPAFLGRWLGKEQDRGGGKVQPYGGRGPLTVEAAVAGNQSWLEGQQGGGFLDG